MFEPFLCVFLLIGLTGTNCQAEIDENQLDWREIHRELYATDGKALSVPSVLKKLLQLNQIYKNKTDNQSLIRKSRIENLLWVAEVSATRCNEESLKETRQLLDFNLAYPLNIVPYIRHYKLKLEEFCNEPSNFANILKSITKTIDQNTIEHLKDLLASVRHEQGVNKLELPPKLDGYDYAKAIVGYLEEHSAGQLSRFIGLTNLHSRDHLRREYDQLVKDKCEIVNRKLHYIVVNIWKKYADSLEGTQDWLELEMICNHLTSNDHVAKMVYSLLVEHYGDPISGLLNHIHLKHLRKWH